MADKPKEIENNDNIGLGVDIVEISRMGDILDKTPNFVDFTFLPSEKEYCMAISNRSVEHFATHFAAKEAVLKALGTGFSKDVTPKDIEVLHDDKGKPFVVLHGKAKENAEALKIVNIQISLSFTKQEAVSVAIALKEGSNLQARVLNKSNDPTAELTRQFKEAKKILDENF